MINESKPPTKKEVDEYIICWSKINKLKYRIDNLGVEKRVDYISEAVSGGSVNDDISVEDNTVYYSAYFSGCGNDSYSFPTKLLYMTNEELDKYFLDKSNKERKAKKRAEAYEEKKSKENEKKDEKKEYLRLKKIYNGQNKTKKEKTFIEVKKSGV